MKWWELIVFIVAWIILYGFIIFTLFTIIYERL